MTKGIQILKDLKLAETKRQHPNYPEYAIPPYKCTDKTANGLTKCIVTFLNLLEWQAERISNEGRVIDSRKTVTDVVGRMRTTGGVKRIKSSGRNGTADISSTILGRSVKIEVKIGKDRQSDNQKEYQEEVERAGGVYLIAKDFQSFYEWYVERYGTMRIEEKLNKNIEA